MGCIASSQRIDVTTMPTSQNSWQIHTDKETVLTTLVRLDRDISSSEKLHPAQRLAVVSAELQSIQQEIKEFEEITSPVANAESYAKTMHQIFVNLDLYRRPILASENEDFVANVNRKEMRKLELNWLQVREKELQREKRSLHAQLLNLRNMYTHLQQLLSCIWGENQRPGTPYEGACERALAFRDALASVSARLRAAAESAHIALKLLDDALPAWKLTQVGKSGWERTCACSEACRLLVHARCGERGARRVLVATAAPRAARALRLALDYAFTDTMHDYKYQRATEAFMQFKEALVQLVNSIHQVLLSNVENLALAEKELMENRRQLRAARVNEIVKKGLADLKYEPSMLANLNSSRINGK